MFYISINFLRYSGLVTKEEAIILFDRFCAEYPKAYVAIRNEAGYAVKERFSN